MALDLEEQEQLDEFKAWWNKNGKWLVNAVIAVCLGYAVWTGYQYFQQKKATEASELYQSLVQLDESKLAEVKSISAKLMESYAGTPYAGRAAVFAAKSNFSAKDSKSAKAQLQWARDNAKESAVKAIASLQLASLLTDEKDYEGAAKVLTGEMDKGFGGLKDAMLGDAYLAQGKQTDAKIAYTNALTNLDVSGRLHALTQQKLDALGS